MTIIHVITAFGIGGAEKLLLDIVNRQVRGHKVHLIYFKPINDLISKIDKRILIKRIPLSLLTIKKLSNYYKNENADIIHTHLGHADIIGFIAVKNSKAKVFCTMHNIYFKKNNLDELFFKIYRYLFLKRVPKSKVISISESVEKHVISTLKVPRSRSFLLYNAISPKNIKRSNGKNSEIKLLFVGRLEKQKSLETLLHAVNYLKKQRNKFEFSITIVGDGSKKSQLQSLAKKLSINDSVLFKGKQENTDRLYGESDIFVLPSIWEGFGMVILEAFRAKLAVIASNIEGPAELINHNSNGLLFEPKNHVELAKKIKLLIDNPNLRRRLANKGYESFIEDYHIDGYIKNLEKLYINA